MRQKVVLCLVLMLVQIMDYFFLMIIFDFDPGITFSFTSLVPNVIFSPDLTTSKPVCFLGLFSLTKENFLFKSIFSIWLLQVLTASCRIFVLHEGSFLVGHGL